MRNIRPETLRELFASETPEAFITCAVIDHPSLTIPLYVCNNNVPLTLTDPPATFEPVEFDYILAPEAEGQPPKARLRLDNVDRRMIEAVRRMDLRRARFTGWLVRGSDPDTLEAGPWSYLMHDIEADERTLSATLGPKKSGRRAIPKHRYTQTDFPALYE